MSESMKNMLILFIVWGVSLPSVHPGYAAEKETSPTFKIAVSSLGGKRKVGTARTKMTFKSPVASGKKWMIARSTDTGRYIEDCVYIKGKKGYCRKGGITYAFESVDGARVVVCAAAGSIEGAGERVISVFEIDSGRKIRENPIESGSSMVVAANPDADLLATYYKAKGGGIVLQAFDMEGNLKWRRDIKGRTTPIIGPTSIAIGGSKNKIFLATIPVPMKPHAGSVLVFSVAGELEKELNTGPSKLLISPDKTMLSFWSKSEYGVYSINDDVVLLREPCDSSQNAWCTVEGFSSDGKLLAITSFEEDYRTERAPRLVKVDVVDFENKQIHRDILNEEFGLFSQAKFWANRSLEIQSVGGKTISYEAIP